MSTPMRNIQVHPFSHQFGHNDKRLIGALLLAPLHRRTPRNRRIVAQLIFNRIFQHLTTPRRRIMPCGDYRAYVIQLVQRRHRREIVYVDVEYLVPYLSQHRVIELEKRQLYAASIIGDAAQVLAYGLLTVVGFKMMQHLIGTLHYRLRHTASLATWIPKLCSLPPRASLRETPPCR